MPEPTVRISALPIVTTPDPTSRVPLVNLATNTTVGFPLSGLITLLGLATSGDVEALETALAEVETDLGFALRRASIARWEVLDGGNDLKTSGWRSVFTMTQLANNFTVSWSGIRVVTEAAGIRTIADQAATFVNSGFCLWCEASQATLPFVVYTGVLNDLMASFVSGTRVLLLGNYEGLPVGILAQHFTKQRLRADLTALGVSTAAADAANAAAILIADPNPVSITNVSSAGDRALNSWILRNSRLVLNPGGEGGSISNLPSGAAAPPVNAKVTNRPVGNMVRQHFEQTTGEQWYRDYASGAWGSWVTGSLGTVINIISSTSAGLRDANIWLTPATYYEITAATISNTPFGTITTTARLDVVSHGAGIKQYYETSDGTVYERIKIGAGAFSAWYFVRSRPGSALNISALSAGQRNFDLHVSAGLLYRVDGTQAISNGPDGTIAYNGYMDVITVGQNSKQRLYLTGDLRPYERMVIAGTPETFWTRSIPDLDRDVICAIGDSITFGVGASDASFEAFPIVVGFRVGARVHKHGTAGGQMSPATAATSDHVAGSLPAQVVTLAATLAASTITLIAFGTNDYNRHQPIGTISDTTNATFYGAMRVGYDAIIAANPAMRVVFVQPTYRAVSSTTDTENVSANSAGHTLEDYRVAIRAFCAARMLQVIETRNELGVNQWTVASLFPDGLHPNTLGHRLLGELVSRKLIG